MKQQLQQRLQELKSEYEAGKKVLADLEAKQAHGWCNSSVGRRTGQS